MRSFLTTDYTPPDSLTAAGDHTREGCRGLVSAITREAYRRDTTRTDRLPTDAAGTHVGHAKLVTWRNFDTRLLAAAGNHAQRDATGAFVKLARVVAVGC
jgi:hypothetical protein